jgi:hypothetical protein
VFRRKKAKPAFNKAGKRPVIRSSICTGEQTAGFKDAETGKFHEVMLIRNEEDFQEFLRLYDLAEADVGREW